MKLERRASFGWGPSAAGHADPRNGLVVHYDGSNQGLAKKSHGACRDYWRSTRKFHMGPSRRWLDIGYSFGVCPHGIVLEGRGLGRQQAAQPGGNSTWYSVTFMSGPSETSTPAQNKAFRELRSWLHGKGVKLAISYHSRFISTSCPGDKLRKMVEDGTLAKGGPGESTPSRPGTTWPGRHLRLTSPFMEGSDVKVVQQRLNAKGADPKLAIDSVYGPMTAAAVKAYQGTHHLTEDGIIGPKTWESLLA